VFFLTLIALSLAKRKHSGRKKSVVVAPRDCLSFGMYLK